MNSPATALSSGGSLFPSYYSHLHFQPAYEPRKRPAFYKIGSKEDVLNNGMDFTPASTAEEDTQLTLGSVVALMGLSGLAMPLLALLKMPFQLLNPNVLLAKAFALFAVPVGIMAYGRSFQYSPLFDVLVKVLLDPDKKLPLESEDSKAFLFLDRKTNSTSQEESLPRTEQCIQRMACEGLLRSLPQVLIKSLLRGQESMLREMGWESSPQDKKNDDEPPSKGNNAYLTSLIPMRTFGSILLELMEVTSEGRKKDLAKLALKQIRNPNRHYLKQGSTNHYTKTSTGPPISKGSSTASPTSDASNANANRCIKFHCSLMM